MARYVLSSGRICQSLEKVHAARHLLAELSDMLFNGELPVVCDTHKGVGTSFSCTRGLESISFP